jgi:NADH dehydrogenase
MAWNVVIAGGGFGGLQAAQRLCRNLPPHSARITLVNETNFMLYTPLLPGAAAGTLEPRHVVVPLREQLSDRVDLRVGRVLGADPAQRRVSIRTLHGDVNELRYDQLIVALGSVSRTLPIPGLAEHAVGLKSLPEAIGLRNRLLQSLEIAETIDDAAERAAHLTYVFVGAGYAGLEGLAELQDFAVDVIDRYPRCRVSGMRWVLVDAADRVMSEINPKLAAFATRELRGRGIDIRTSTTLQEVTDTHAVLSDGERIATRCVVWTAGVRPNPVVAQLGLPLDDRGRIPTDKYLQVEGHEDVWAIGDAAGVPDPAQRRKQAAPPTAQHATREGKVVADNVAAALGVGRRRPFRYRTLGVFVDMGRGKAVASTVGVRWRGRPAWWLARTYHLLLMPGWGRRARLLVDWNIGLLFGRDTAELGQLGQLEGLPPAPASPQREAPARTVD